MGPRFAQALRREFVGSSSLTFAGDILVERSHQWPDGYSICFKVGTPNIKPFMTLNIVLSASWLSVEWLEQLGKYGWLGQYNMTVRCHVWCPRFETYSSGGIGFPEMSQEDTSLNVVKTETSTTARACLGLFEHSWSTNSPVSPNHEAGRRRINEIFISSV